ncbi:MAG: hypothetical protein FWC97_06170 [Treponema sp.]|nr:hypothetical protein [Treponema sp.]
MKHIFKTAVFFTILIMAGFIFTACGSDDDLEISGSIRIIGNAYVGQELSVDTSSLQSSGRLTFQWRRGGEVIGNDNTYVVQSDDLGYALTVTVISSENTGSIRSAPTAIVIRPPFTGTVSIIGSGHLGHTLRADTSGMGVVGTVSYQWIRDGIEIDEAGARSNSFTVQLSDNGSEFKVRVTSSGNSGESLSEPITAGFVEITEITDVPTWMERGTQLTLTGSPYPARQAAFTWSIEDRGTTNAQLISGRLIASSQGTVIVRATVADGIDFGVPFSATFNIAVIEPVTEITGTPSWVLAGNSLSLTGMALPVDATSRNITWSIYNDGGTGAVVNGNTLQTTSGGTAIVTATVIDGHGLGVDFTQNISISVNSAPFDQWITRVNFTGAEQTIHLHNLSGNDVFLVKTNLSDSEVIAANTGRVLNVLPDLTFAEPSAFGIHEFEFETLETDRPIFEQPIDEVRRFPRPPISRDTQPRALREGFTPPVVGEIRQFWLDRQNGNNLTFVQADAELMAAGNHGNIWVVNNSITQADAQMLSDSFDIIYPAMTNIFGYEYGGRPNHPNQGGRDGDPNVQILVYNITMGGGNVAGFFWPKDFFTDKELKQNPETSGWKSNNAEIFYLNANFIRTMPVLMTSVLVHELQHMIMFNEKEIELGFDLFDHFWFNEMLSMMAEDIMAEMINIHHTNSNHVTQQRIPGFLAQYDREGITEWNQLGVSYATKYAFGAFLLRNFGGAELVKNIMANNYVGIKSVTEALNLFQSGLTFEDALRGFAEAMIFTGQYANAHTFNRGDTRTINNYFTYTSFPFDIWNMRRGGTSSEMGPNIFNIITPRTMRPHSVVLHSSGAWRNVAGTKTITLQRPEDPNIEFAIMVR